MLVSPGVLVEHSTTPDLNGLRYVLRQCGDALSVGRRHFMESYPAHPGLSPEESSNSSYEENADLGKRSQNIETIDTNSDRSPDPDPGRRSSDSDFDCPRAVVTDIKTLDLVAKQVGMIENSSVAMHAQRVQETAKVFGLPREDWVKILQLTVNRALWSTLPPEFRVGERSFQDTVALLEHNQHPGQAGVAILSNLSKDLMSPHINFTYG
ncbi:unnamed protein product [Caretta caretta]